VRWLISWLVPACSLGAGVGLLALFVGIPSNLQPGFQMAEPGGVHELINTNVGALTSVLGVLIALVLLSVQLTAQRYSFNVIGLFIQNWANLAVVGLFFLTIGFNLWLGSLLRSDSVPASATILAVVMTTVCLALLPPYVIYLFHVLRPDSILNRLQRKLTKTIRSSGKRADLPSRRVQADSCISQIGDIARTAVNLSDGAVARHSLWVLHHGLSSYLDQKAKLPPEWFSISDFDFEAHHELVLREIEETRTAFERRALDEMQVVFYASLNKMHDVNNTVALVVRLLGERAVERNDMGLLMMIMKFFNTFLREAINEADARAGYHTLYQYRLLADSALERRPEVALEIAQRLSYYGDAAASGPLLWMSAAAGHDLRMLAEASYRRGKDPRIVKAIVDYLLDTLERAEAKASPALVQLYKTGAALGSFFQFNNASQLGTELRGKLNHLPRETLEQVRLELTRVDNPIFWELTDRVVNFDYLEPEVRAQLPAFLASLSAPPALGDGPELSTRGQEPQTRSQEPTRPSPTPG
jgi:hypothetical protein